METKKWSSQITLQKGEKQNTKQKVFPALSVVTYHLLTETEVITVTSQTEALMTDISQ